MLTTFSSQQINKKPKKKEPKKNQQPPPSYDSNMPNAKMPTICVHTHLDAKMMMTVVLFSVVRCLGGSVDRWCC